MKNNAPTTITIDGPAASGKTTLGHRLAESLGYLFFDTGVMYRAVAWAVLQHGVAVQDEQAVSTLVEQLDIDVQLPSAADGRTCDVSVNGQDVTWDIRRPEVEQIVSQVAAYAQVRRVLTAQQRKIGLRGKVVMVGRDIGTVVLPEAQLKVYLEASAEERARRRFQELHTRGEDVSYENILNTTQQRDLIDSTRTVAPLQPAADAIIINSDNMDEDMVLSCVSALL